MFRTVKSLVLLFFMVLLNGCASPDGPPFELQPTFEGLSTIYLFRTASIVGGGNSDIVAVNDKFIGRINSGTYAVYNTAPGEQKITRKAGSIFGSGQSAGWGLGGFIGAVEGFMDVMTITTEPKRYYFIRFPQGELVPNQQALELMDRLEDVTALPK